MSENSIVRLRKRLYTGRSVSKDWTARGEKWNAWLAEELAKRKRQVAKEIVEEKRELLENLAVAEREENGST
jgi:CRISPR/Cas system-associated endonuclease Cas1